MSRRAFHALLGTLLLAAAAALPAAGPPDLARALAVRDLEPVRAWLADVEGRAEADSVPAWRARIALTRIDAPEAAAARVAEARARYPDDAGLLLQQAAIELDALEAADGRFERMREARAIGRLLDRALELDPDHPEALAAAIGFHREVPRIAGGREERVGPWMERLATLAPAREAYLRFEIAAQDRRLDDAAALLDEAIARDPLTRPAWTTRRAALSGRLGDVASAINALEALLVAEPAYAPAWFELGRWIAASDRPPAPGIAALERYLLMDRWPGDPSLARALVHLATLKTRAGDPEGARRALDQARILDASVRAESDAG
ncbi:hypothetical protein HFP89_05890 [Wenzhouxiangella sp. XN79A]|uniref:tetratricopeptide repeat protein n=1 Tax=Wenzhouxiangella sp. XN79A TaxID=2724193 RepID=UPI00144AD70C|nr:hypothetical protein [Wenzhouxiangella sp. XN79A]NKI34692.1 hypothetical protein [Wenzhouxiangella sp. XN79A]